MSTVTRADIAPGAGVPVRRRGAYFLGGFEGVVATAFAPTSPDVSFEWTMAVGPAAANERIMGRYQPGRVHFVRTAGGSLVIYEQSNGFASFVGAVLDDSEPHRYRIDLGVNTQALYIDGELVSTKSGTFSMATGGADFYFGNYQATGSGLTGALWDVKLINHADDSRTSFYPLDARNSSGDYPNTHPGSTAGDGTLIGSNSNTVLPVLVNAPGGDGLPVYPAPVVVCARRDVIITATSGNIRFSFDSATDPYGWMNTGAGTFSCPFASDITFHLTGRMRATTIAASTVEVQLLFNRSGVRVEKRQQLTLDTVNKWVPFAMSLRAADVDAGRNWDVTTGSIGVGDAVNFDDIYFTAIITPSTTTTT